jgi:hypothetical protein
MKMHGTTNLKFMGWKINWKVYVIALALFAEGKIFPMSKGFSMFFFLVVRQMPGYEDGARPTLFQNFCVLCFV